MNTNTFTPARPSFFAGALALSMTLAMLLGVNGLAAHGAAEAQLAAAAAQWAAAPALASSGV
jgi:hypothetical protein